MKARREVEAFASAMERALRQHDDKGGWKSENAEWLIGMAASNLREDKRLEKEWAEENDREKRLKALDALVDCANYCMMSFDLLGGL